MKYTYATLLLQDTGAEISEQNLTAVLEAADADASVSRVKAVVAALEGVDVDEYAATPPSGPPDGASGDGEDPAPGVADVAPGTDPDGDEPTPPDAAEDEPTPPDAAEDEPTPPDAAGDGSAPAGVDEEAGGDDAGPGGEDGDTDPDGSTDAPGADPGSAPQLPGPSDRDGQDGG